MNAKFFDVKKGKQDAIINAALKIFATNGYRKASTDVIVKEAGISKGLLFHYFISKQGLYEFIHDYSVKYMILELTQMVKKSEKDFFVIQQQIEFAKTRVMKNYPYMQQFLSNIKFETHPDALKAINEYKGVLDETYRNIYNQTDKKRFLDSVDVEKVIGMINWMSEGFIRDKFRAGEPDLDAMNEEFGRYLSMLRAHFYKSAENELISEARFDQAERDDTIMDAMKMEMTFEERLMAGKRPLVDIPEEEKDENQGEESESAEDAEASEESVESETTEESGESEEAVEAADNSETENAGENAYKEETEAEGETAEESENEEAADTAIESIVAEPETAEAQSETAETQSETVEAEPETVEAQSDTVDAESESEQAVEEAAEFAEETPELTMPAWDQPQQEAPVSNIGSFTGSMTNNNGIPVIHLYREGSEPNTGIGATTIGLNTTGELPTAQVRAALAGQYNNLVAEEVKPLPTNMIHDKDFPGVQRYDW